VSVKFEWDPKKAASNLSKHGVAFEEGLTVFKDPLGRIFDDEDHSLDEQREIIIGHGQRPPAGGLFRGKGGVGSAPQRAEGNQARTERL